MSLTTFASTLALASFTWFATAQESPSGCTDPYSGQTISWDACGVTGAETLECATLEVPIDYTDLSMGKLTLPIVRVPATGSSPKGSIITNPGGPGGSGISLVVNGGTDMMNQAGGDYHILSFDPRGVGLTTPYYCPPVDGNYPGSNLPLDNPTGLNATWKYNHDQGIQCNQTAYREAGTLVGTAFDAQDIMSIVNALGEDGMIRYWGFSYGTLLGATTAAMFPDKIDRMILDGNINPTDYYHGLGEESVDDVDASVQNFFAACASAGPDYCVLADGTSTGAELEANFNRFIGDVANGTVQLYDSSTGNTYSYNDIKGIMFANLKSPTEWPGVASAYLSLYQAAQGSGRLDRRAAPFDPLSATDADPSSNLLTAVTCGDWDDIPGDATLQDFQNWLKLYESRSSFGADQLISILYGCATWQVNAKEKYTGSFEGIDTHNPIFYINGHWDPVTPFVSAQNSSHGFTGSGLLETNIPGHCSSAMVSSCVNDKVKSYFSTGKIPDISEKCDPDAAPFLPQPEIAVNITDAGNYNRTHIPLMKRIKMPFEYPEQLRHVKRDVYEILHERRAASSSSSGGATCTALAPAYTASASSSSSSGSGSGGSKSGADKQVVASGLAVSVMAVIGALALLL